MIVNDPKCSFYVHPDGYIQTDGSYCEKITGTSIGGIISISPWDTPFSIACKLLGLYGEDLRNKPAIVAGTVLEKSILDYFKEDGIIPAAEIFGKHEGPHSEWVHDFEDDIFGGHCDGVHVKEDGNCEIVEIKTSARLENWTEDVPAYYKIQAFLYSYFLAPESDSVLFILGTVNEKQQKNPSTWSPEGNVYRFRVPVNKIWMQSVLEDVSEWYKTFILADRTPVPDLTNNIDSEIWKYLTSMDISDEELKKCCEEACVIKQELDKIEAENKEKSKKLDELKDKIKLSLSARGGEPYHCSEYNTDLVLTKRKTSELDKALMYMDNINLDKYYFEKESNSLTFKQVKQ